MATQVNHLIDVRMEVKEATTADLKPGDRVWYFIKKHVEKNVIEQHAHGPFTVVTTSPKSITLRNQNGVELSLNISRLILLVTTESPPKLY
jgi:hypothetical protein